MRDQQFGTQFSCHESTSKIRFVTAQRGDHRKTVKTPAPWITLIFWSYLRGPRFQDLGVLLSRVGQSPSERMQQALLPSMKGLIVDELLRNSNEDVKINVAACLNQIMRISAPIAPYDDQKMKEIFELIVASFDKLSSLHGRCYSKAIVILETVARIRSCVMMLDLDCDPLITKMFEHFLKNISSSSNHPHAVFLAMETIMSVLIKESDVISLELVKVLLASIRKENQNVSPKSWTLGVKVIEECSEKLKPHIMEAVVSMGCTLEDFGPILCSICKVETDNLRSLDDDSSKHAQENSNPSASRRALAEPSQSLEAVECCSDNAAAGKDSKSFAKGAETENTTSKREWKPNSRYFGEGYEISFGKRNVISPSCRLKKTSASKGEQQGTRTLKDGRKRKGRPSNQDSAEGSGNESARGPPREGGAQQDDASESQKIGASQNENVIETPYGRKNYKEDLVGCRIKVWWPLDRRYYEGAVSSYDPSTKKHKVDYDDGDEEILDLWQESWEFIGDELAPDITTNRG